ncbi:uncharacterized protein METZ01_LOCUS436586 [marine metagenome]|uniref:Uncharacterized protein n=1 Tax=marine metagenome TaxID=408172 RepID=A0A382YKB4_9ZZZZ
MPATACRSNYLEKAVPGSSNIEQTKQLIAAGRFYETPEICRPPAADTEHRLTYVAAPKYQSPKNTKPALAWTTEINRGC